MQWSVAVVLLALCAPVSARETTSFDAGWLFQLGDAGYDRRPDCNASSFAPQTPGTICKGKPSMIFVASAKLCEAACCGNPDCTFWQFCDPSHHCLPASPVWGCYNGYDACPVKEPATNWTAMARTAPPPPPRPIAAACTDSLLPW